MKVSEQQLAEFMRLYKKRFGTPIDRKDAQLQARMLLRLVDLLRSNHHKHTRQIGRSEA